MRFIFLIFFFLFSFSLITNASAAVSEIGTEVGRYAPPVNLTDLSGNSVSLEAMRGSVVLLSFWSTFCSPCTAEMPSLNRLYTAFREKGLQVVSIALDPTDSPVREYVAKNSITFPVLLDTGKEVFLDDYSGPSLPATYLIDRNGVIAEKFSGLEVWDAPEMKNRVLLLLEKK